MIWYVDEIAWDMPCTLQRVSEVESSDLSGMMLDKSYFNDVLGTWLKYSITVAVPKGKEGEYAALYEVLTSPSNYHRFNMPYNNSRVNINGRVQTVSDTYVRLPNDRQTWRKITFDVIASTPSHTAALGDIEDHGLTPYPEDVSASIGDLFEYTRAGWVQRFYGNADETRY